MSDASSTPHQDQVPQVQSFTTEKGSVYTANPDSTWTRFKKATGELHRPLDMTVFANLDDHQMSVVADVLGFETGRNMVPITMTGVEQESSYLVLEELGSEPGSSKFISQLSDVTDPKMLVVTRYYAPDDGDIEVRNRFPVGLRPQIGAVPIEFKKFDGGASESATALPWHLGHAVVALAVQ